MEVDEADDEVDDLAVEEAEEVVELVRAFTPVTEGIACAVTVLGTLLPLPDVLWNTLM